MTNVSVVEKISELMQQIEVNSPRVAALHYCLSEAARHIAELDQKLAESQREFRAADATIENLQMQVEKLAAEAQGFKRFFLFAINAAFDGCDITGDQIQEVAKEIGLVRVETYSAEKHAEMSGDPSVMEEGDDFYIMNKTPATEAFLAEVRAQGVERLANAWYAIANETDPGISISDSSRLKYRQRADDAADFANEIRQEAAQ